MASSPIRDDLRVIGRQATKIQETLNGHAPGPPPSTDEIAQHVERPRQRPFVSRRQVTKELQSVVADKPSV